MPTNFILFKDGSGVVGEVSPTNPLPVTPTAGSGAVYTEGDTDTTIDGTPIMWEDASDTLRVASAAKPLPVQQAALLSTVDNVAVVGTVANDGVDSGNPVKIGGKAITAQPTAVAAADRVDATFTTTGKMIVMPYTVAGSIVSGTTAAITGTTTTQVVAGVASNRLFITHIIVQNSHATVSTLVTIEEETSGTDLYTIYAGAAGGGASVTLPVPLLVPTAGKGLFALCGTTGANVYVSASGYSAP